MTVKKRKTICAIFILVSFLWNCGKPSENELDLAAKADTMRTEDVSPDASTEYMTSTGKRIIISETHPAGQSLSHIEISTRDFEHNYAEVFKDKDPVSNVLLADLDRNGFDEIYIITTSAGSGSYGSILGFASNKDKSLSMINFPKIEEGSNTFQGYMGHDTFTIKDHKLVRTFPVYRQGDPNQHPTGGTRKLIYGLFPGEAMWQLKIEKSELLMSH